MSEIPVNPYAPDTPQQAAFAGRQSLLEHLDRYLMAPVNDGALLITGQRGAGKTTLLRHFGALFGETHLHAYVALSELSPAHENDLWRALALHTAASFVAHDFTASRLPDIPPTVDRDWFGATWLAELLNITRSRRLIVWLIDDAGLLLDAHPEALNLLLDQVAQHASLKLILAFDTQYATRLDALAPPAQVHRIGHLTPDETAALLRVPVRPYYQVSDEAAADIYRLTGGHPRLAQDFARHLFEYWQQNTYKSLLASADVRAVSPGVYQDQQRWFQHLWDISSGNERLTLRTISHLIYADPLTPVTADSITGWLADSDYPLDATGVNAAIRSLEYREILYYEDHHLRLSMGLFQQWLLERRDSAPPASSPPGQSRRYALLLIGLLLITGLLLLIILSSAPRDPGPAQTAEPTVTLVGP